MGKHGAQRERISSVNSANGETRARVDFSGLGGALYQVFTLILGIQAFYRDKKQVFVTTYLTFHMAAESNDVLRAIFDNWIRIRKILKLDQIRSKIRISKSPKQGLWGEVNYKIYLVSP